MPLRGNPAIVQHPIQGRVAILLVTQCYENWDKGHFGLMADFTFFYYKTNLDIYSKNCGSLCFMQSKLQSKSLQVMYTNHIICQAKEEQRDAQAFNTSEVLHPLM